MKSKSNIHALVANKTLSIPLILIFSVCLFVTHALAGGCNGAENCFKCGQMDHRHPTGPQTGFRPSGCQPATPNTACGIAANRIFDSHDFLVSSLRIDSHEDSSLAAGPAGDDRKDIFSHGYIAAIHSPVVRIASPIYLLNLALLC